MNSRVSYSYVLLLFVLLIPVNGFAEIRHACFIVNPASNNGKGWRVWDRIEEAVDQYYTAVGSQDQAAAALQATYNVFFTEHAGHATELAMQAYLDWQQMQYDQEDQLLIVAVGGDGTVHEMVQGLEGQPQVVFGVIPAGKGNDIANTLRLRKPMHALRTLVYGTPMPFGAYKIEGCESGGCEQKTVLAVNEFELGLMTRMKEKQDDHNSGERPSRLLRYSPASMAYPMLAISTAMSWNTPMVRCRFDRGWYDDIPLHFLAGGTGPTVGGGVSLHNDMGPSNFFGSLIYNQDRTHPIWTLIQITMETSTHLIWRLIKMTIGRLYYWSGMQRLCFTQLNIENEMETPLSIQVDGDVLLQTPAQVTWLRGLFQFMRPPVLGELGHALMDLDEDH
ncbi:diacylglycerol kinase family protein [Endozoicomonas sp. 4G]|uniref:diacylglycerol/lipid kinase family protein n=1 Tax=Endozoicomonas sp. 4G TaxID=2872754 RepID=UPI0020788BCC|nr:diacylglycerol kinase family protein [Endozoicomonas sp. 4G]